MLAFLATMGERPEAITVALDRLQERFHFDIVVILHTNAQLSRIGAPLKALQAAMQASYPDLPVHYHELLGGAQRPIVDILSQTDADDYYHAMLDVLAHYKSQNYRLHLLVSGGRKAMSIYATLAAGVVFNSSHDKVWTVLSPPRLINEGQWHIPAGFRDEVHLVEMPLITARLAPGSDPRQYVDSRRDDRSAFLAKLTPRQKELVEMLRSHPDMTNAELAQLLNKSEKTIENQFVPIYNTLTGFLELGETIRHKRRALLDILREE